MMVSAMYMQMVVAVQALIKRLEGCNGSKRRAILEKVCKVAGIKVKRQVLKVVSRWNSTDKLLTRSLFLLPAFLLIIK